eukprot:CAMPEP_0198442266 /NCGR_PEP_ID=MMETSP1452-20131203/66101_1 /TAXON_ID=1181717 /ORGANISM="Synchroma pusillum, Strain CCMP3072" /LENGTH=107 /DNA_ID=CAMNT_0044162895 /DNA_START=35 /DNA_END=354 /DNA_ORIENTATION=-
MGGEVGAVEDAVHSFGLHVGLAFQLVDDALDFEASAHVLGKPSLADLRAGLATAPVLFAAEEFPHLASLIQRKFEGPGDIDEALQLVQASRGLQRTKEAAQLMAEKA